MEAIPPESAILIDENQVAEMLDVDVAVVRRWRATNQGPQFLRLARSIYKYRREDVVRWLDSRAVRK
jgi:hypothetical protein